MTKQEKIRKGIRAFFESNFYDDKWHQPIWSLDFAVEKFITDTLHSQGVVIKAKCPDCAWSQFKDEVVGMTPCDSCNSTGYIIEPLI